VARKRTISIIEAPSNLGLMPPAPGQVPGVVRAPDAFREAHLASRLRAQTAGRIDPPLYRAAIEPETGIRNSAAIRGFSVRLAEMIEREVRRDHFTMVVGGDCSILLGSALALRRLGRYGLVFIDGHTDFHTPKTSRTGGAAGMDLALATGYGPDMLTNIGGLKPLIRESDVWIVGNRDITDPARYPAAHIFKTQVQMVPLDKMRTMNINTVVQHIVERYEETAAAGFFIHLDVDVLDSSVMPAVDSPMPGGMTHNELARLLRALTNSELAVGMNITIFDPDKDPDGSIARSFVNFLVDAFQVIDG
jgi:arginase